MTEEVFRVRTAVTEPEPETPPTETTRPKSDKLAGNEDKATDPLTEEEKTIDIWEGLNRRKFITEYFDIGSIDGEFNLKMDTAVIDKFIKKQLEDRGYEKNIDNYKSVLEEIEAETGSSRLEIFKRIKKLAGYAKAISRLEKAKALKENFLNSTNTG